MRRHSLDNLRWAAALLVFAYHICYLYNGLGIPGGIPGAESLPALDILAGIVYPWFMVLLFVIAGMSAQYALERRTDGQFLRERRDRLLAPSTLGLLVVHWVTGYLNIRMGGGLAFIPPPLVYPISVISGIGPLWFAQMLFVFSCLLVLLRRLGWAEKWREQCENLPSAVFVLLFLPLWGAAQVLNLPVLTMYRFGIYLAAFLIGYLVLSHEAAQEALARFGLPLLAAAAAGGAAYTVRWLGKDYTDPACLRSGLTNLYAWTAILAALGCGRRYFDGENAFTRYMRRAGFGIYVLHYPVLLSVCYCLHTYFDLPAVWNYLLALAAGLPVTLALYEIIQRTPVIRYLVLGRRGR